MPITVTLAPRKLHPSSNMFRQKSVKEHLGDPDIPIDQHADMRACELGRALRPRQAIYLDTCFWVFMKNALTSESKSGAFALLEALREKVTAGLIFCPISDAIFVELMKQTDPVSRATTTALIDELSLGVTLIPEPDRFEKEVRRFVRASAPMLTPPPPLDESVWCKLAYILGVMHPHKTAFEPALERAIQKAYFDHMWSQPLSLVVNATADVTIPGSDWTELASKLNAANATHAQSLRSFRQAFKAEVRGTVDLIGDFAVAAYLEVFAEMNALGGQFALEAPNEIENFWKNVVAEKLEGGAAKSELPSLHIIASLHASLRWNKHQKLDSNDIFDFQHATAALAYCDAFFTERPLCSMIKQNHLRLDHEFDCYVTSSVDEASAWVRKIEPN